MGKREKKKSLEERVVQLEFRGDTIPKRGNRVTRFIAQALMNALGWRIRGKAPDLPKLLLIGAPHTSNWDLVVTLLTIYALGFRVHWIAKHTLFRWPIAGFMRWLGGVAVNRKLTKGFVGQIVDEYEKRDKFVLAIMPEGTRSKASKWRSGFYYMALGADVPLLPIIFDYGNKVMRLGPLYYPSGDFEEDLPEIKAIFAGIQGKNPHLYTE